MLKFKPPVSSIMAFMWLLRITSISVLSMLLTVSVCPAVETENFDQVNSWMYRGGEPDAQQLADLKDLGIRTLIDFRTQKQIEPERAETARALGMNYINIPWDPEFWHSPKYDYFDIYAEFESALNTSTRPVYVHCQHGRDRTGSMIAAYRIIHEKRNLKDVMNEMKRYNFNKWKYWNLWLFLRRVHEQQNL